MNKELTYHTSKGVYKSRSVGLKKLEEDLDAYEGTEGKLKEMDQLFVAASTYLSTKDVGLTAERLDHVRENVKIEEASEEFQGLYNALLALIGPELAKTYHEAGYVAFRNEDFKAAIDNYLKAVYYDPNNAEALFDLGNAYRRDGDSVNAVTIFNRVIELFPETDTARKAKQFLVDYDAGETE